MMKQHNRSMVSTSSVLTFTTSKPIKASNISRCVALFITLVFSPVFAFNIMASLCKRDNIIQVTKKQDALGRTVLVHCFKHGIFTKSAGLFNIVNGHIGFCGVGLSHQLLKADQREILRNYQSIPGFFSLYQLHQNSGLAVSDAKALLIKQLTATTPAYLSLLGKSILCVCLFSMNLKALKNTDTMTLFGLNIHNVTMNDAVNWVTMQSDKKVPKVGFFINVNSLTSCKKK